jgi:acetolactate synthase-1/2/3 large subunit
LANACTEAIDFAEKNGIPFVLSWGAFDICSTFHPLRVGAIGVYGDRSANFAIQNADLLIIVGSRLDTRQTGGNASLFSRYSRKIMIDIDEHEIDKLCERGIPIDVKVCCDALAFFQAVKEKEKNEDLEFLLWKEKIDSWKCTYAVEEARKDDNAAYEVMNTFFEELPENVIVISDIGSNMVWTLQSAKLTETQQLFTNFGNASMGFALPAAIGAAIASGKPVFVVAGDGGFQMNVQELQTVKTYGLPIHITVLDNGGYGMIKQFQDTYFKSRHVATCKEDIYGSSVDFAAVAKAYGITKFKHVHIPETQRVYPKLEFGNALENMSPLIDSKADMIVNPAPVKSAGWI